jgi:hypothetical protein
MVDEDFAAVERRIREHQGEQFFTRSGLPMTHMVEGDRIKVDRARPWLSMDGREEDLGVGVGCQPDGYRSEDYRTRVLVRDPMGPPDCFVAPVAALRPSRSPRSGVAWTPRRRPLRRPIGGLARGYQAIFVPLAAFSSSCYDSMDGQPAVYLYIAALEVNVLNCRDEGR